MRVHKTNNFTVMSNTHFREKRMSLKAKGLLSLMLSLPDDWDYSINGLCKICIEKESAIKSTLKELMEFGYLVITKLTPDQTASGRIEYKYDIYEVPQLPKEGKQEVKKQGVENLPVENLPLENQSVENPTQLRTKVLRTKESNTNKLTTKEKKKETVSTYDEIINKHFENEEVKNTIKEFIKMRKLIKAPMTNKALELMIGNLKKMSHNDTEQIEILNRSIENSWKGIFELKNKDKNKWCHVDEPPTDPMALFEAALNKNRK